MADEERLSFSRLEKDVVEKGICTMCHGCVCFCTANDLNVLTTREDKPVYNRESECLKCGICHLICPKTTDLDRTLKDRYNYRKPAGHYESIRSLRTTDKEISKVCCDGGVVTSILKFLLEKKRIDGAILTKKDDLWNNQPMIATKFEELLECAGSTLAQSASIGSMGDLTTYASIFNVFRQTRRLDFTKLAVVGTPCQIQTIRKMQLLRIVPSHLVQFTIGLFCYENFLLHEEGKRELEEKINAKLDQIKKINLKKDFIVELNNGKVKHIPLEDLGSIIRPACRACYDFSNFAADISVGGLGSPNGYTTTLTRNEQAENILHEAIRGGYLKERRIKYSGIVEKMSIKKIKSTESFIAQLVTP